jgi:NADPH-dependent curcumin reductase CurA
MNDEKSRRIVLASRPDGKVRADNFRLETVDKPPLPPGGLLLRTLLLSLDPYMRGRMDDRKSYAAPVAVGGVMEGEGIAEVMETDHPAYARGDLVLARVGWRTHAPSDGTGLRRIDRDLAPVSTRLGVLGMPGFTAYSGLKVIGRPKAGETLVVAAASGPVGSLVGQLAQMAGVRAIGIAGGADKCRYVAEDLGFDAALDHRDPDFPAKLAAACPKGIDIYFENVGGAIWQAVLPLLNLYARVPVCGLIAQYNGEPGPGGLLPATMRAVLTRSLTLRGFINTEFVEAHHADFLREVAAGIAAGRIRYREDVTDGLENAPAAFMGLLEGRNFGKALVRIAD